jgi:S1-C subfamily serine protease
MMHKLFTIAFLLIFSCLSCVKTDHFPTHTIDSFVKVKRISYILKCDKNNQSCQPDILRSSGSGAVVSKGSLGGLILTAAHVCDSMEEKLDPSIKHFELSVADLTMKEYEAAIVNIDYDLDACILAVQGIDLPIVPVYQGNLAEGTKAYNVAAPVGIMKKNMVPLLDGYFTGNDGPYRGMYTIPAAGGSSGSPIVNSKGELIGMIHSVNVRFPMITISPELENLRKFIVQSKKIYNFAISQAIKETSQKTD